MYLLGFSKDQAALYTKALMKHPKSRTWMTKVISLIFGVCLLFGAGGTSADDTQLHRSNIDTDKLLCWAVGNGDIFQVKLMLSLGADTSHMEEGVTALMGASLGGYRDIVELLMNNGSDIHLKNVAGTNALMYASMEGHSQIVDLLLRKGARVNDKDFAGQTAIFQASVSGSIETVRLLIAAGADLKVKNKLGITALYAATEYGGNAGIVKLLRESTAVDEKSGNSNSVVSNNKELSKATLHEVTVAGDIEAARKLISNGADINMRDVDGYTSLMHASYAGYDGIVRLLVDSGAEVDLQNNFGATAINLAASNGHVEVVKSLVMRGTRFDVPAAGDITPLDIAKYSYKDSYRKYGAKSAEVQAYFSIIEILQTAGAREDIKVLLSRLNREKIQTDALGSQKSRVLSEIIEKGRDIVPAVLWAMEKKTLATTHGSIILEKIGNPAVEPMIEFLEYQEPYSPVTMLCVHTLGKLGRGSAEAASILAVLYSRLLENDKKTKIGAIYLDTMYAIRPDWFTKQHLESLKNSLPKEYVEEK